MDQKKQEEQSALALPRPTPGAAPSSDMDLLLHCADHDKLLVSSSALMRASFSEALQEVLRLKQKEAGDAGMTLDVAPDKAATWQLVYHIVRHPMAAVDDLGLTWVRLLWLCVRTR